MRESEKSAHIPNIDRPSINLFLLCVPLPSFSILRRIHRGRSRGRSGLSRWCSGLRAGNGIVHRLHFPEFTFLAFEFR